MRLLVFVTALIATVGVAAVAAAPRPGEPVLALFDPALTPVELARRLAAAEVVVAADTTDRAYVIASNLLGDTPGRLYAAGARLVINADFAFRCLPLRDTP